MINLFQESIVREDGPFNFHCMEVANAFLGSLQNKNINMNIHLQKFFMKMGRIGIRQEDIIFKEGTIAQVFKYREFESNVHVVINAVRELLPTNANDVYQYANNKISMVKFELDTKGTVSDHTSDFELFDGLMNKQFYKPNCSSCVDCPASQ